MASRLVANLSASGIDDDTLAGPLVAIYVPLLLAISDALKVSKDNFSPKGNCCLSNSLKEVL